MVVYGAPEAASASRPYRTSASPNVTVTLTPAAFPDTVAVRVVNYTANTVFQTFTFNNKPAVTVNYLGNYQPHC